MTSFDGTATEELLRRAGLRSTAPRRAVLQVLDGNPHQSAAGIAELLGTTGTTMSRQSLYNVLDDLSRTGVLRSIQPTGSAPRYETNVGDNHHHLVCRGCGTVADVACAAGRPVCQTPASVPEFPVVDEADITWWGLCTNCAPTAGFRTDPGQNTDPKNPRRNT